MENIKLVSKRMERLLSSDKFELSDDYLKKIHKYLFSGVYDNAGVYRCINLSKEEDILDGDSVLYAIYYNIDKYMEYDFCEENVKDYSLMNKDEVIDSISDFTIRLWSTHPFRDGNTRTISVFIRQYLKKLGFTFDDSIFITHFDYFRNALVRAIYSKGTIHSDDSFLHLFYEKLLFNNEIILDNSSLYLKGTDINKSIKV